MQRQLEHPKKILIKKKDALFEVHWDYQNAPNTLALRTQCERLDGFLDGFIDGALTALEIPAKNIYRIGSSIGTAKNLEEHVAIKLATILTDLFRPLLKAEPKSLYTKASLHHLRDQPEYCKSVSFAPRVGT
ncbi:hypothetical protein [Pseudomonas sp. PH1b]|uniref:hypothetical protein n=1 Tax=Pseudomonas sp. PH1b TaxID=1397282 RepID=UPI00046A77A7|nr:hypothetical protein [Pseudomonas sp. PH1b]